MSKLRGIVGSNQLLYFNQYFTSTIVANDN